MFNATPATPTPLDDEIARLMEKMKTLEPETKDYDALSNQVVKLTKLQHETTYSWLPSADVLATCAVNLLGIVAILNFERAGVIATKALGFVGKLK